MCIFIFFVACTIPPCKSLNEQYIGCQFVLLAINLCNSRICCGIKYMIDTIMRSGASSFSFQLRTLELLFFCLLLLLMQWLVNFDYVEHFPLDTLPIKREGKGGDWGKIDKRQVTNAFCGFFSKNHIYICFDW